MNGSKLLGVVEEAEPIFYGDIEVTLEARSWTLHRPGWSAGLVYNRPQAVWVKSEAFGEKRLPIIDQTRRAQVLIWVYAGICTLVLWLLTQAASQPKKEQGA
ncbi:MAG: hypothetical protein ACLFWD_08515 [Anaerolineales bacterium]